MGNDRTADYGITLDHHNITRAIAVERCLCPVAEILRLQVSGPKRLNSDEFSDEERATHCTQIG